MPRFIVSALAVSFSALFLGIAPAQESMPNRDETEDVCGPGGWTSVANETTATVASSVAKVLRSADPEMPEAPSLARSFAILLEHAHEPSVVSLDELSNAGRRPLRKEVATVLLKKGGSGGSDPEKRMQDLSLLLDIMREDGSRLNRVGNPTMLELCESSIAVQRMSFNSVEAVRTAAAGHDSPVRGKSQRGMSAFDWESTTSSTASPPTLTVASVQAIFKSHVLTRDGEREIPGDLKAWFLYNEIDRRWLPVSVSLKGDVPIFILF